jgi:uncharacterized paraquat-inducible protein A
MSIAAKGSSGVFAECPHCHASIRHGFQVCQHCGATVSAQQQSALQRLLAKNVLTFAAVALTVFAGALYVAYQYIR